MPGTASAPAPAPAPASRAILSEDPSLDCDTLLSNSLRNAISLGGMNENYYDTLITFNNNLHSIIKSLVCNTVKVLASFSTQELTAPNGSTFAYSYTGSPTSLSYGYAISLAYTELNVFFGESSRFDTVSQQFLAGLFARYIIFALCENVSSRPANSIYPITPQHRANLYNIFNTVNHGGIYDIFTTGNWTQTLNDIATEEANNITRITIMDAFTHINNNCIFNGSLGGYMLDNNNSAESRITSFFNSYKEMWCALDTFNTYNFCPVNLCCTITISPESLAVSRRPWIGFAENTELSFRWTSSYAVGDAVVRLQPPPMSTVSQDLRGENGFIKYKLVPNGNPNPRRYKITVTIRTSSGKTSTSTVYYIQPRPKPK